MSGRSPRQVERASRPSSTSSTGLTAADFRPVARNGFGDPSNAYVHCTAEYRGHVYAETSRHSIALKLFASPEPPQMRPWPVRAPSTVEEVDMRGQIWRTNLDGDDWGQFFTSPEIDGTDGLPLPRHLGYRGMAVFQGVSDNEPALSVGVIPTLPRECFLGKVRS